MSADAARKIEMRGREWITSVFAGNSREQMGNVREAFRLRRLARHKRYLHGFYDEHNMFAEARGARIEMLQLLRTARSAWRRALGLAP